MKRSIYFIRHAKAKGFQKGESDFERSLKKKGYKDIKTIGSYLQLYGANPDIVLSSCALRAQQTAIELLGTMKSDAPIQYLQELYEPFIKEIINIIQAIDEKIKTIFIIGHAPQMIELINYVSDEHISKLPTLGVVKVDFDCDSWEQIDLKKGCIDFFIYPKQFQYYLPNQIRAILPR